MNHSDANWQLQTLDSPTALNPYVLQIHHAAQFVASMGNSYLPQEKDDSQSNMAWVSSRYGMISREIKFDTSIWIGLLYHPFELHIFDANLDTIAYLSLGGHSKQEVQEWLINEITRLGGDPKLFNIIDHYTIPHHPVNDGQPFEIQNPVYHQEMAKYRSNVDLVLKEIADAFDHFSAIRIWPHHFDTGAIIFAGVDEQGNATKTVGVGMSIPDENINEYYYYVNHWSKDSRPNYSDLPELSAGHWVMEGWVGAVLPISTLLSANSEAEQHQVAYSFFKTGINAALKLLDETAFLLK